MEATKSLAPELGFELVGYEVTPLMGTIDTTVERLRLAGKSPDLVYVLICGATLATTVKDCARLDILKKGITLIHAYPCWEDTLSVVGTDGDGWYVQKYAPAPMEGELPGMKTLFEAANRYSSLGPEQIKADHIVSWIQGQVSVHAIRLAIQKVGFENLTGRAVRDALASVQDFDTGLMPPITMTDTSPHLSRGQQIYITREAKAWPTGERFQYPGFIEEWLK